MQGNNLKIKRSYYGIIRDMTDKQAGEFIKGLCAFAFEGKPFNTKDNYLKGIFLYLKRELEVSEQNSVNGRKGGLVSAENRRNNLLKNPLRTPAIVTENTVEIVVSNIKEGNAGANGRQSKSVAK